MENNTEKEILVLYYDKETKTYHPVLLNDLEEGAICAKITEIFAAKGYDSVMVDERNYKLFREEDKNAKKRGSSNIQTK